MNNFFFFNLSGVSSLFKFYILLYFLNFYSLIVGVKLTYKRERKVHCDKTLKKKLISK